MPTTDAELYPDGFGLAWGRTHPAMRKTHLWVQDETRPGRWYRVCNGQDTTLCHPDEDTSVGKCKKCVSIEAGGCTPEIVLEDLLDWYPFAPTRISLCKHLPLLKLRDVWVRTVGVLLERGDVLMQENAGVVRYWASHRAREAAGIKHVRMS